MLTLHCPLFDSGLGFIFCFHIDGLYVVFKATKTPTFGLYMTSFEALVVKMRWTNNEAPRWVEINSMRLDKLNPKNSNFIFYGAQAKRNTSIAICVVTTPLNNTMGWGHNFVLLKKLDLKCKIGWEYAISTIKNSELVLRVSSRWHHNVQPLSQNCRLHKFDGELRNCENAR